MADEMGKIHIIDNYCEERKGSGCLALLTASMIEEIACANKANNVLKSKVNRSVQ